MENRNKERGERKITRERNGEEKKDSKRMKQVKKERK